MDTRATNTVTFGNAADYVDYYLLNAFQELIFTTKALPSAFFD